ncbi:MAG TPA: glycoside hydrolase family 20 zincin-like fold domain-containing protein, partial [Cyclobacteriaceae bacterium]|nr:glycoside hydrolase family 20 zincin-like fold domain-containing protein [Cyclobacteriaceae bacterium]
MNKVLLLILFVGLRGLVCGQSVNLVYDRSSRQAGYAAGVLEKSLVKNGYSIRKRADYSVTLAIAEDIGKQSYRISFDQKKIAITGGDGTGLIYGSFALAEELDMGTSLNKIKPKAETPALAFRAIKFDLP